MTIRQWFGISVVVMILMLLGMAREEASQVRTISSHIVNLSSFRAAAPADQLRSKRGMRNITAHADATAQPTNGTNECVKCPSCLQRFHAGCLDRDTHFLRSHLDCKYGKALCSRNVWECPNTGIWFTYPTLTPAEIANLYKNSYSRQARMIINDGRNPRILGQQAYINKHILSNPNMRPNQWRRAIKNIVEIGCAAGFLSATLAAPDRHILCFEADPHYADTARKNLLAAGFGSVEVVAGPWDPRRVPADGIDLFVSSHVLEHMPDLCGFFSALNAKMNPGAFVFTEIPNHTREYIMKEFGGEFHVTFPSPQGFLAIMQASNFEMVAMDLFAFGQEKYTKENGAHIRSVFAKPSRREHGGLGWTP